MKRKSEKEVGIVDNYNYQAKSAIFGLIVGDALGVPVEFKVKNLLEKQPG